MIHISNSKADEILTVLGELRHMACSNQSTRADNMRRRARLIEKYINNKKNKELCQTK